MGSAFGNDGLGSPETVIFGFDLGGGTEDPLVLHRAHAECALECPHLMSDCGRFKHGEETSSVERPRDRQDNPE